jgi:hypothetical protein
MVQCNNGTLAALEQDFERIAFTMLRGGRCTGSHSVKDRHFRAWFGCSLNVLSKLWFLLCHQFDGAIPEGASMEQFLWALILLKSYDIDEVNASRVGGVDECTFCKWAWWFIEELSYLESEVVHVLSG